MGDGNGGKNMSGDCLSGSLSDWLDVRTVDSKQAKGDGKHKGDAKNVLKTHTVLHSGKGGSAQFGKGISPFQAQAVNFIQKGKGRGMHNPFLPPLTSFGEPRTGSWVGEDWKSDWLCKFCTDNAQTQHAQRRNALRFCHVRP